MNKLKLNLVLLLMIPLFSSSLFAQADLVVGKWLNEEKDGKVEIYKKGDQYFGKLVWIKNPNNDDGSPKLDVENPEESLKSRPLQGLEILKNFVYNDEEWEDGEIYDPKSGKTYSCYMKFEKKDVLMIKGYIGVKWVGRTTNWTRSE